MTRTAPSLQDTCCNAISLDIKHFTDSLLDGLNTPCLQQLAQHLSLIDLLKLRSYLTKRGIRTDRVIYKIQRNLFKHSDTYPIKAVTCPHLLNLFPTDTWEWALSRLLYRRLIVRMVEEKNLALKNRNGDHVSPADLWALALNKHTDIHHLFCPQSTKFEDFYNRTCLKNSNLMKTSLEVAARNIYYVIVDLAVCKFLMDSAFDYVLNGFCSAVKALSVLIKSSYEIVSFIRHVINEAKDLDKICIFAIKDDDLDYFDEIMGLCSGVSKLRSLEEQKEIRETTSERSRSEENFDPFVEPKAATYDFDLMDDAVLMNTSSMLDSNTGMQKADFKVTNLVDRKLYIPVLTHHLTHWLTLKELHLGVPDFNQMLTSCVCSLIKRPQFKVLTLSSADFTFSEVEEILYTVASSRQFVPMEKLMFVSMMVRWENPEDISLHDRVPRSGDADIDAFLSKYESEKMTRFTEFYGTKLFEWYACTMGLRVECLIRQFISKDKALVSLSFSNSLFRRMMTITMRTISPLNMPLTQVIIEDWHVLSTEDCKVLVDFLHSISTTLESLNLANSVLMRSEYSISDVWEALYLCKELKYLDMSSNNLRKEILNFIPQLKSKTKLKELSLRRNSLTSLTVDRLFNSLQSENCLRNGGRLNIMDLRGNDFTKEELKSLNSIVPSVCKLVFFPNMYF